MLKDGDNMQCQICHVRQATVHFTNIVNNQKVEMHLCEQCANEKGQLGFAFPISINGLIAGLLGFDVNNENNGINTQDSYLRAMPKALRCEKCGMTIDEFLKIGKLGCSNCYTAFEEKLNPLIRRLQGSIEHNGKVPGKLSKTMSVTKEIAKLKDLLNKAIEKEEYEKAAEIRDRIKSLEVGLNGK